ncbi:hypothetical protein RUM44_001485 [Polyplax serrata]|uniref:Anaphase-promoting complex subunit 4 n=1 Tax=Polyplax serrata TaxID=468196 RepID=A0ABR1ALW3_POLSC
MSSGNAMRQLEERHSATKIELMVWSTKLDLLALSYANGEVALHRLNWLKVWVLAPPAESVTVKGIAWRPDAKVLAIGYSTNEIYLVDVENKEILNKSQHEAEITSLTWTQDKEEFCSKKANLLNQKIYNHSKELSYKDECSIFLPKLPSLNRSFGPSTAVSEDHVEDAKKIRDQQNLNLLLVGLGNGKLCISVFGLFPSAIIDIKSYFGNRECIILDSNISKDFKVILVAVCLRTLDTDKYTISMLLLNSEILSNNCHELHMLVLKYGHLISSLDYLNQTLQSIIESWENILIEMDSKLTAYASKVPPGQVSADFLELLMFGTPSPEMGTFLLQDLTERGLKKLGNSIELSYLNIQKLVLKHLHSVGQNLAYHVDELWGLSRCPNYCQILGLNETYVNKAFISTGSFLIKATEVQQVIDSSLKRYKAFFRWLYTTILRLSDDRVSSEMSKISQQDLQNIAEFLYNFEGEDPSVSLSKPKFNLERLGQYLLDKNLDILSSEGNEPWTELLEQKHPLINQHQLIIPHHKEMSLVQEIKHLEIQINCVFKHSEEFIGQHFKLLYMKDFVQVSEPKIRLTNTYFSEEEKFLIGLLDPKSSPPNAFYFIDMAVHPDRQTKCVHLSLGPAGEREPSSRVTDLQFYLPDVLSILVDQKSGAHPTGFVQLPVKLIKDLNCDVFSSINIQHILDNYVRNIEGIVASKFAVSGSRKVSVILSENKRKVKLFEMEAEDEEDDDDLMETTGSYKESDDSRAKLDKTMEESNSDIIA